MIKTLSSQTPNSLPTFFTPEVLDQLNGDVKMLLVWAGPLIMIIVGLFVAYGVTNLIIDLFQKKKEKKKLVDDDDDFEYYRY